MNFSSLPEQIPIKRMPDLYTPYIGRLRERRGLFWGTTTEVRSEGDRHSSIAANGRPRYYSVLFLFSEAGELLEHRSMVNHTSVETADDNLCTMLAALGDLELCDIAVRPFSCVVDGIQFGLIVDQQSATVTFQPNSTMTFMAPWDGEYFT